MSTIEIQTSAGVARAHVTVLPGASGGLVLGHGAGGGVRAADLLAVQRVATELGWSVALVEQPYRVAGRRAPSPARQLDLAWVEVCRWLCAPRLDERGGGLGSGALVVGGRSSGARVACRTATAVGAAAVLCLAFPLHPPGRPDRSRLPELEAVRVPMLIVQGERDAFGMPPARPTRQVVVVPGDHSLRQPAPVADAVAAWLTVAAWLAPA